MAAGLTVIRLTVGEIGSGGHVAELLPGLALDGIGMGIVTAPLTGVVLAGVSARYAGVASGVQSTMVQLGNAVGVAVIGIVFYDTIGAAADAGHAIADGFGTSVEWLIGLSVVVAGLTSRLSRPAR